MYLKAPLWVLVAHWFVAPMPHSTYQLAFLIWVQHTLVTIELLHNREGVTYRLYKGTSPCFSIRDCHISAIAQVCVGLLSLHEQLGSPKGIRCWTFGGRHRDAKAHTYVRVEFKNIKSVCQT